MQRLADDGVVAAEAHHPEAGEHVEVVVAVRVPEVRALGPLVDLVEADGVQHARELVVEVPGVQLVALGAALGEQRRRGRIPSGPGFRRLSCPASPWPARCAALPPAARLLDGQAGADPAGDLDRREPDLGQDLAARGVVEELLGDAEVRSGTSTPASPQRLRDGRADAAGAAVVLDDDDHPVLARRAAASASSTGLTQRGSTTVRRMPVRRRAGRRSPGTSARARRRRRAGRPAVAARPAQHVHAADPADGRDRRADRRPWGSAPRSARRRRRRPRAAGRAAGRRRAGRRSAGPGTTWRIDMSHMPLWEAPSAPVTPARSRTKVTPHWCRATSISTWSKARLRKVA